MYKTQTQLLQSKVIRERYIVDELLGQGGSGAVYRVHDRRVRNNVFALKEIVDPNKRQRKSFTFEGELLQRLDHPYLPRVYRLFEDEKYHRLYILMDYIDGPTLEHLRIQQPQRRFAFAQTLKMMAPIIEAVIYLHNQTPPIIHRDIKPANIVVLISGEGAVLVDFGIAKEYDLDATTTAIRHCSPGYGAPEQYICDTNPRTDIYGLGATFYTLLTGEVPVDSLYRITSLSGKGTDPLIPINDLASEPPAPVASIIQRALAINSNERFPSVEAFWQALKACESEKVTDFLTLDVSLLTDKMARGNNLTHLPTVPLARNLSQPRQVMPACDQSGNRARGSKHHTTPTHTITGMIGERGDYRTSLSMKGINHKNRQMLLMGFVPSIILALSAGAIFVISQWLSVRQN